MHCIIYIINLLRYYYEAMAILIHVIGLMLAEMTLTHYKERHVRYINLHNCRRHFEEGTSSTMRYQSQEKGISLM
jgi:hypothetical protein